MYEQYLGLCCFTPDELVVLNMKRRGETEVAISMALPASTRTVERKTAKIRRKIEKAEKYLN